jgi:hypothetical protein
MIGLTPYDDNQQINAFKAEYGLTNPCAGVEVGGPEAIAVVIDGQPFFGYPTYCVVCPDRKIYFNVCFPPTPGCFDSYIVACGATDVNEVIGQEAEIEVFPNPAKDVLNIQFNGHTARQIRLFNQFGLKVREFDAVDNQHQETLSLRDLPQGVYFLHIETEASGFTQKISVIR